MSASDRKKFEKYLSSITKAAKFIDEHFINKEMKYTKADNKEISVIFEKENFMHLCGIKYKKKSVAFFKDAKKSNISLDEIEIKNDGTTFQKLEVLDKIEYIIRHGVLLTGHGVFLNLSFDSAIKAGNRNIKFAISLKDEYGNFIPISLFNTIRDQYKFPKGEKVTSIEEYDLKGKLIKKHI